MSGDRAAPDFRAVVLRWFGSVGAMPAPIREAFEASAAPSLTVERLAAKMRQAVDAELPEDEPNDVREWVYRACANVALPWMTSAAPPLSVETLAALLLECHRSEDGANDLSLESHREAIAAWLLPRLGLPPSAPGTVACVKCDGKGFYEVPLGAHHDKRTCLHCGGTGQVRPPSAPPPEGPWRVEHWPDRDEPWRVLRHEADTSLYVEDHAFMSEAEALAVRDALNRLAARAAPEDGA